MVSQAADEPLADRPKSKQFEFLLNDLYFRLEERDKWADQTIKYLLYGNGGSIALLMAFLGASIKVREDLTLILFLFPIYFFLRGLISIGHIVRHAADSVRKGRHKLKQRMIEYLEKEDKTYVEIFREMGDEKEYPSKWSAFESLSKSSFKMFVNGVVATGIVFGAQSVIYNVQDNGWLAARLGVFADRHKRTGDQVQESAPTLPARAPNPTSDAANSSDGGALGRSD